MLSPPSGPNILSAFSNEVHARKKRVLSQAFSDKAMKSTEEYTLIHIRRFCEKLASASEPLDMASWCTFLTGDLLGEVCFGESFNMLTESTNRRLMVLVAESAKLGLVCGAGVFLRDTPIPRLFFSSLVAGRLEFRRWAMAKASKRTQIPSFTRKNFYHYLMEAKNPLTNENFEQREMWSEAGNLIVAGTDTTATTLAATFFYLTRNPEILERVRKEVRTVFKACEVEDIKTGEKLQECKYLRACIDESMRMSPPLPGILPRAVLPGGLKIDGHSIPAGTEVGVSAYAFHHNETYHKDSFIYDPERFLGKGTVEGSASFSLGPRACIGKNMAYMELMNTMVRVLWLFDFECVGSLGERVDANGGRCGKGEYRAEDFFVCNKFGPEVVFRSAEV